MDAILALIKREDEQLTRQAEGAYDIPSDDDDLQEALRRGSRSIRRAIDGKKAILAIIARSLYKDGKDAQGEVDKEREKHEKKIEKLEKDKPDKWEQDRNDQSWTMDGEREAARAAGLSYP